VMRRIAAPMVGGMVSSTVLTLVVIPVIYYLWRSRELTVLYADAAVNQTEEEDPRENEEE
ncbi:MAG: hypothetical protein WBD30_14335, partial [Bacteroidota bacterium]